MRYKIQIILIFFLLSPLFNIYAAEKAVTGKKINKWLMLGPAPITNLEKQAYDSDKSIANHRFFDVSCVFPQEGKKVLWSHGQVLSWKKMTQFKTKAEKDALFYFVTYLDAREFQKSGLVINHIKKTMLNLYLNGQEVKKKYDPKKGKVEAELTLMNKNHILLLKVFVPQGEEFSLDVEIADKQLVEKGILTFSVSPYRRVNVANIINMKKVTALNISPDSRYVAVSLSKTETSGETSRWTEILNVTTGSIMATTEGLGTFDNLTWLKNSGGFLYTRRAKKLSSIFRYDLISREQTVVKSGIKDLRAFRLSPDNSFILYWTSKKKDLGTVFKYIKNIPDRAATPSFSFTLYLSYLNGGAEHKIKSFSDNLYSAMISPDNKKVLISTLKSDTKKRPYYKSTFGLLDLTTGTQKTLFESNLVFPFTWSPDSTRVVFIGGPSSFNGIGRNVKSGVIPNEYDNQVFIYNISTRAVKAITKNFNPSVDEVFWNSGDGNLYLRVTDRAFFKLYRYQIKKDTFTEIKTTIDAVTEVAFPKKGKYAVFWGSGARTPYKLFRFDLSRRKVSLLKDYNVSDFKYVRFGKVKDHDYLTPDGKTIMGRIHYPPDFDPMKKYPCIVYYYGGSAPVERYFGGRYPFNWYAANGYLVYVLQPSGAIGFGQEFSAVHVNDWGKITSKEVIGATKHLIKTHHYIDPKRLGGMGASYGGFLTQYLATQTDIFAALISHAGISALSSYWGIGDYGYSYSGHASAESFPWNRRDIYVDQSPLFLADKINTPLLLLHGDRDNNVPPGESYQMFAALKLLGKEVALVTMNNQAHWVLSFAQRVHWMKTIMAWFDKWLKGDSLYWDTLYEKYQSKEEKK
jgi:dipeptidyl aminopeptidase/acylaminoacyl peptidase